MPDAARFLDAIRKIEGGNLDLMGLIGAADAMSAAGEGELAKVLYKHWLLANPQHPLAHIAAFNCGSQMLQEGDLVGAREFLGQAVAASPDFFPARQNLASAWEKGGDIDSAMAEWQAILDRLKDVTRTNIATKVATLKNIARVRRGAEIAETVLKQAIEIDPVQRDLVQHWVNRRQARCVWPLLEPVGGFSVPEILERLAPLSMSCYTDDPFLLMATGRAYTKQMCAAASGPATLGTWPVPSKAEQKKKQLRIGYLSSDFCHHAVGYLMSDVFGAHDRKRFAIHVFNIGERNNDAMQTRIMSQVDAWTDIRTLDDRSAAKEIVGQGIDILIDMNGHTNYQRTALLALKPAPIIVNWLGYPGSMGSEDHHYLFADDFIIPPEFERHYSEKVLRLPVYQPNGKLYDVPALQATRAELGLPEDGVVFCCFNGSVKITEQVFTRWLVILASVPGSVLWLRGAAEDDSAVRLRAEAQRRGIDPARLVFLPFRSNTEYLGCHRYADLFLDTFPYTAHTTASDALRMGVPIVTLAGLGFPSRVCGSLSRAAGLPDLVCHTPDDYVRTAVVLGNDRERLRQIKQKLADALPGCALFDSPGLVRVLEKHCEAMWADYCAGRLPKPRVDDRWIAEVWPLHAAKVSSDFVSADEYARRYRLAEASRET